jgi:hypothetical protein
MRVAARFASTWVTTGERGQSTPMPAEQGARVIAAQMARLDDACAAEGRDPSSLGRLVLTGLELDDGLASAAAFAEVRDAYAAVGVTDLVTHWPRATPPFAGDESVLEAIAEA